VRLRHITTLLLLVAAAVTVGCGADQETKPSIPRATAHELEARLAEIERRFQVGGGACDDIVNDSQPAVESILASMPSSVDPDVRNALTDSFDRLFELVAEQCKKDEQTTTPTETQTQTEPDTTDTTDTETTDTQPPETVPTETLPTETVPTTPPDNGTGQDGGGAQGPGQ
jgi:hypothetical protein